MRPRRLAVFVALVAGSCAANNENTEAYFSLWADCLRAAAARLDDGKSDPSSIAIGITSACASHFNTYREYMVGRTSTQNAAIGVRAMVNDQEIKMATTAVLYQRAATRRAPQ